MDTLTSGLSALWASADIVTGAVLVLLISMWLVSCFVLFTKLRGQRKLKLSANALERRFWTAPSIKDAVDRLPKGDEFRAITEEGLRAAVHHDGRLTDRIDLHEWITMSLQRAVDQVNSKLQAGLDLLTAVSSVAPIIGLIGTLWGILRALMAIGIAGQTSIDKVAGPVGESLIITVFGLFVAVSAMMSHHWLSSRNKSLQDALRAHAFDVHAYLVSGARVPNDDAGGARPAARRT